MKSTWRRVLVVARLHSRRDGIEGVRIAEAPKVLRHFGAQFARCDASSVAEHA